MSEVEVWSADQQCIVRFLESGLVIITVDGEFQVKLGIMDDKVSTPWRLYQIELFIRDPEEPGKCSVDPPLSLLLVSSPRIRSRPSTAGN